MRTPDVRLTTRQAAAYPGCAHQTLRNWRCEGIGPKWHRASIYNLHVAAPRGNSFISARASRHPG
jgi:hypothetical protein